MITGLIVSIVLTFIAIIVVKLMTRFMINEVEISPTVEKKYLFFIEEYDDGHRLRVGNILSRIDDTTLRVYAPALEREVIVKFSNGNYFEIKPNDNE